MYRARDVRDVHADLQEFNTRSSELTGWMLTQTEALSSADNDSLTAQQLRDKVSRSYRAEIVLSLVYYTVILIYNIYLTVL